jgi:hypothetical protein
MHAWVSSHLPTHLPLPPLPILQLRAEVAAYPSNLTLLNLGYFLVAPTLSYQPAYPRATTIRVTWLARCAMQACIMCKDACRTGHAHACTSDVCGPLPSPVVHVGPCPHPPFKPLQRGSEAVRVRVHHPCHCSGICRAGAQAERGTPRREGAYVGMGWWVGGWAGGEIVLGGAT